VKDIVVETLNALKKNGFQVSYFDDRYECIESLVEGINENVAIGIGGSTTIKELGIVDELEKKGNIVHWHWLEEDILNNNVFSSARRATIYISSTNGISQDGKIINIDGMGNRISSLCFGHEKVYIIVGKNKISKDVDSAIERIKKEVCPKNAERLNLNVPCRYTGKCSDCSSMDRMCSITCIIEKQPMKGNIHVCIIDEVLGF